MTHAEKEAKKKKEMAEAAAKSLIKKYLFALINHFLSSKLRFHDHFDVVFNVFVIFLSSPNFHKVPHGRKRRPPLRASVVFWRRNSEALTLRFLYLFTFIFFNFLSSTFPISINYYKIHLCIILISSQRFVSKCPSFTIHQTKLNKLPKQPIHYKIKINNLLLRLKDSNRIPSMVQHSSQKVYIDD